MIQKSGSRILASRGYTRQSQVYKGVQWNFTKMLARKCSGGSEVGRTGRILKNGESKTLETQETEDPRC